MTLLGSIRATLAATASGPSLADWLTAGGTVLLALITAITLIATVRITRADRRHDAKIRAEDRAEAKQVLDEERARAEQDRADAALRLREEREIAHQRLQDERDYAENTRRRERQADNAQVLIQRIAVLQPYLRRAGDLTSRRRRCFPVRTSCASPGGRGMPRSHRLSSAWLLDRGGDARRRRSGHRGRGPLPIPCPADCHHRKRQRFEQGPGGWHTAEVREVGEDQSADAGREPDSSNDPRRVP